MRRLQNKYIQVIVIDVLLFQLNKNIKIFLCVLLNYIMYNRSLIIITIKLKLL